jgi:hypothetical protein
MIAGESSPFFLKRCHPIRCAWRRKPSIGASSIPGGRRRTLSLRFFGPDGHLRHLARRGVALSLTDAQPFRHPAFPKLL